MGVRSIVFAMTLATLTVVAIRVGAQAADGPSGQSAPPKPYVAITSIAVSTPQMHSTLRPNSAVVTVEVSHFGRIPDDATAKVDVYSGPTQPLGNNVAYSKVQVLPVRTNPTVFRFTVRPERQTVTGSGASGKPHLSTDYADYTDSGDGEPRHPICVVCEICGCGGLFEGGNKPPKEPPSQRLDIGAALYLL